MLTRVELAGAHRARSLWLDALRSLQLTEELGWCPSDPAYGAWGDAISPSRKADTGRAADADISSTLFALGALRIAGTPADDAAVRKALGFVVRCQNFAEEQEAAPTFDDGGFFFTPTDPVRNKAGVAGADRRGHERYHSYGSATADGLRALLRCGLTPGIPVLRRRGAGWNGTSRQRTTPAPSPRPAHRSATPPTSITPGRSPMPSGRWGDGWSAETGKGRPGPSCWHGS